MFTHLYLNLNGGLPKVRNWKLMDKELNYIPWFNVNATNYPCPKVEVLSNFCY